MNRGGAWSVHRSKQAHYRPDIDGLRALAIVAVIGFHYHCPGLSGGFVGVDVFFVISGFLIGSIIHRQLQKGDFRISQFYERRFRRILPALLAVIFVTLLAGTIVLSPAELKRLAESSLSASVSLSNILFIFRTDYFAGGAQTNPLLMTWSLAVEEQFYVVFPLLMIYLRRRPTKQIATVVAALAAVSLLASIYAEFRYQRFNFYLPITRGWSIGLGVVLALWKSESSSISSRPSQIWR